jgi:hypothetical protein
MSLGFKGFQKLPMPWSDADFRFGGGYQQVDIGEVYSLAEGFAHALVANDDELISSYLSSGLGRLSGQLGGKSQPNGFSHFAAQVLSVTELSEQFTALAANEFVSITRLSGAHEEFLVRAVWTHEQQQLLIRALQMVERKPVSDQEARSEAS